METKLNYLFDFEEHKPIIQRILLLAKEEGLSKEETRLALMTIWSEIPGIKGTKIDDVVSDAHNLEMVGCRGYAKVKHLPVVEIKKYSQERKLYKCRTRSAAVRWQILLADFDCMVAIHS